MRIVGKRTKRVGRMEKHSTSGVEQQKEGEFVCGLCRTGMDGWMLCFLSERKWRNGEERKKVTGAC